MLDDDNADNWRVGAFGQSVILTGILGAAGSSLARVDRDGAQAIYVWDASKSLYVSSDGAGAFDTIDYDGGASEFVWTDGATGASERYQASGQGRLLSASDADGNTVSYLYNSNGTVQSVTDASGEVTHYDYVGTQLNAIRTEDASGASRTHVRYAYDSDGRLSSVSVDLTPEDGDVSDGNTYVTTYTYDGSSHRVASVVQSDGTSLTFTYVQSGGIYKVATVTDGLGAVTQFAYDTNALTTTVTDPLGAQSVYEYDTQGQLLRLRQGVTDNNASGANVVDYAYDLQGNVLQITDGRGNSVDLTYDSRGNLLSEIDATGNTRVRTYGAGNQLLTDTVYATAATAGAAASQPETVRYVYAQGNSRQLRFVISAEGGVTEYRYDSFGQRTASIQFKGGAYDLAGLAGDASVTESEVVAWRQTQDLGQTARMDLAYDARGSIVSSAEYAEIGVDGEGISASAAVTHYIYDARGLLLQKIEPGSSSAVTSYTYDGLGRVLSVQAPSLDGSTTPSTTITSYDDANGKTAVTLANGLITTSAFDHAGRLVSTTQHSVGSGVLGVATYSYDARGNLLMSEDPTGARKWMLYDEMGRKIADIDATGALIEYVYDTAGLLRETIAYSTPIDTAALVDEAGHPTTAWSSTNTQTSLAGLRPQSQPQDQKVWNFYDNANRLIFKVDALGYVTETVYDGASRVVSSTRLANQIDVQEIERAQEQSANSSVTGADVVRVALGRLGAIPVTLSTNASSVSAGSLVYLEAKVEGVGDAGVVTFFRGNIILGTVPVVNGIAGLETDWLESGLNNIRASYTAQGQSLASVSKAVSIVVTPAESSASLSLSNSEIVSGSAPELTMYLNSVLPEGFTGGGGDVRFYANGILLGVVPVVDYMTSLSAPIFPVGDVLIRAVYSGDAKHASTFAEARIRVEKSQSDLSLKAASTGTGLRLTAQVSSDAEYNQPFVGEVAFYDGTAFIGRGTVVNGIATLDVNYPADPTGHPPAFRAQYSGDAYRLATQGSAYLGATLLDLEASVTQVAQGSPVTIRVRVIDDMSNRQIRFFADNQYIGSAQASGGWATLTVDYLPVGAQVAISASILDTDRISTGHLAIEVTASAQNPAAPVVQPLTISPTAIVVTVGEPIGIGITVPGLSYPSPSSFLVFDGETLVGKALYQEDGKIFFPTLSTGTHNLTIVYEGNSWQEGPISVGQVDVTVERDEPDIELTTSMPDQVSVVGKPIAISARVNSTSGIPAAGTINFYSDGVLIGSANLVGGVATMTWSGGTIGTHRITASYSGDANHKPFAIDQASPNVLIQPIVYDASVWWSAIDVSTEPEVPKAGSPVSIKASIRGSYELGPTPTGTVHVFEGGQLLGSGSLIDGVFTLSVPSLSAGVHNLRFSYEGSQLYATTEGYSQVVVEKYQTSATLSASATSVVQGQAVTLTANVDGGTPAPSGQVDFFAGSTWLGSAEVINGHAVLVTNYLPVGGNVTLSAVYSGDGLHLDSVAAQQPLMQVSAGGQNIQPPATQAMSVIGPSYPTVGQPIELALEFPGGQDLAGGHYTVFNGQTIVGTYQADPATPGRIRIEGLPAGSIDLKVVFTKGSVTGVAQYQAYVDKASTGVSVYTSPSSAVAGQPVTFTINLRNTSNSGTKPPFTGSVYILLNNGVSVGPATVVDGVATFTSSTLPLGSHQVRVQYSGDANHLGYSSSYWGFEAWLDIRVDKPASYVDILTFEAEDGAPVRLRAQPGGSGQPRSGTITFYDGQTLLGTASLAGGVTELLVTGLSVGEHQIRAVYSGDGNNAASETTSVVTIVKAWPQLENLSATPLPATGSLSVRVSRTDNSPIDGVVNFYQGSHFLGSAQVVNGIATLPAANLPGGAQNFTAIYLGDERTQVSEFNFEQIVQTEERTTLYVDESEADRRVDQVYRKDGKIQGYLDEEGYLTEYKYNAAGELVETIRYADRVAGLETAAQRAVAIAAASASHSLVSLRPNAGGNDVHAYNFYDARGRLVGVVDGEGYLTETVYDARGNVVESIRYYNKVGSIASNAALANVRPLLDARDQHVTQTWSAANQLISQADTEGTTTTFSYNNVGQLVKTVSAAGTVDERVERLRYDVQGRLIGELDGRGSAAIGQDDTFSAWADNGLTHTYDAAGRRISTTDANGHRTLFFYDAVGRLAYTVNALGEVAGSRYDALGQLIEQATFGTRVDVATLGATTPGGLNTDTLSSMLAGVADTSKDSRTSRAYAATGALISSTDALGSTTFYSYDAFREVIASFVGLQSGLGIFDSVVYDRRGLAVETSKGNGLAVSNKVYDAFGRLIESIDPNGHSSVYTYDRLGRVVTTVDALQAERITTYDAFNRVLTQRDALGNVTAYSYDVTNRSVTVTTPEGISTTTVHTRQGQTQSVTDGRGNTVVYAYDRSGNLVRTEAPEGVVTENTYDKAGFKTSTTDANGVVTEFAYDAAGRVLTRTVDAEGLNLVTTYVYDAKGQAVQVTDARGTVTQTDFDLDGRVVRQIVDPANLALATTYTYDANGTTLNVVDPRGTLTVYTYDDLGRRIKEQFDPQDMNLVRQYVYDAAGNMIEFTDANGNSTRYVYDANNRQVFSINSLGDVQENRYDAEARLIETVAYATSISPGNLEAILGQPSPTQPEDIAALLTPVVGSDVVQSRRYDKDDRLTYTVDGTGAVIKYVYDASNNVTEMRVYANRIDRSAWALDSDPAVVADAVRDERIRTVYDALNRRTWSVDGTAGVTQYLYDGNGNVVESRAYANQLTATALASWDGSSGPDVIADPSRDQRVRTVFDAANRATWRVDGAGGVTHNVYDNAGNVIEQRVYAEALSAVALSAWDGRSDLVLQPDNARDQQTRNIYDAAGRMTWTVDGVGAVQKNEYDANGNVVMHISYANALGNGQSPQSIEGSGQDQYTRYIYDAANRVEYRSRWEGPWTEDNPYGPALDGREEVSFDYDGVGRLLRKTVHTSFTYWQPMGYSSPEEDRSYYYVYDAAGRLSYTVDPEAAVTRNIYDGAGRLVRTEQFANAIEGGATFGYWDHGGVGDRDRTLSGYGQASRAAVSSSVETSARFDPTVNVFLRLTPELLEQALERNPSADRVTRMTYDAAGRRTFVVDAMGGLTQQVYDAFGNVTQEIAYANRPDLSAAGDTLSEQDILAGRSSNALADRVTRHFFDQGQRQVLSIDALGGLTELRYDGIGRLTESRKYASPINTTALADEATTSDVRALVMEDAANDRTSRMVHDAAGRPVFAIDAQGYVTKTEYDGLGQVSSTTQYARPISLATTATASQIEAVLEPDEQDRTKSSVFDALGRTVLSIDALGYSESWTYDMLGNKTSYTNAKGSVWTYEYDGLGRLVREVSPEVEITALKSGFKDRLQVDNEQSGLGSVVTEMRYDVLGNMTRRTEGVGLSSERSTDYTYDRVGRQIRVDYPEVDIYEVGEVSLESPQRLYTTTIYDAFGDAIANRDVAGNFSIRSYDNLGRLRYEVDALGYVTGYTRSTFGDTVALTRYAFEVGGDIRVREEWWGEIVVPRSEDIEAAIETDGRDRTILTTYDRLGRSIEVKESEVAVYDAATGSQGTAGKITRNTYNSFGDLVQVAQSLGADDWVLSASNYYDRKGQLAATVDALGYLTKQAFDAVGNVVDRTEFARSLDGWNGIASLAGWTGFSVSVSDGAALSPTLDAANDRRVLTSYDRNNRKTSETRVHVEYSVASDGSSTRGDLTTTFRYDAVGNLTRTIDAAGASTYSYYDALGRVVAVEEPARPGADGVTMVRPLTVFRRDVYGNVVSKTQYLNGGSEGAPVDPRPMPSSIHIPNPEVASAQAGGWTLIGGSGYMSSVPFDGGSPVYRLRSDFFGPLHYYTQSSNERDILLASGIWHDEGILGYLADNEDTGTIPLYKVQLRLPPFWPPELQSFSAYHLLTTSWDEVQNLVQNFNATFIGTVGYVGEAQSSTLDTEIVRMFNPLVGDQFYTAATIQADPFDDVDLVASTDRTSFAKYDAQGRLTQSTDEMGVNHYYAYNERGQVAVERQYVTESDGSKTELRKEYFYDALGRQTEVLERGTVTDTADYSNDATARGNIYSSNPRAAVTPGEYPVLDENGNPVIPPQGGTGVGNGTIKLTQLGNVIDAAGGEVKFEIDYTTPARAIPGDEDSEPTTEPGHSATYSKSYAIAASALQLQGVSLTPDAEPIATVSAIRILQKDGAGNWVVRWQGTPADANGANWLGVGNTDDHRVSTSLDYNAFGELVSKQVQAGETQVGAETFDYDNAGNLVWTDAGNGVAKTLKYDRLGRQTAEISGESGDPNSRYTGTVYDALGRVIVKKLAARESSDVPNTSVQPEIHQNVDRWGNVVSISDPRSSNWVTHYSYNANNQLVRQVQTDSDGVSGIDANGNVVNANAPVTSIYYDAMGRQVAVHDANGNVNGQEWDDGGNLVRELHADGNGVDTGVVSHTYNAFGNRVSTTDAEHNLTSFTFDKLNRNVRTNFVSEGVVQKQRWDEAGRLVSQTNGNNETTKYGYDVRGNLIWTTQPMGQTTYAGYDALNRKVIEMDANGALATWTYDYFGKLTAHRDIGGALYSYTYDSLAQLKTQTNTRGQNLSFDYDGAGQLIRATDGAIGQETAYAYDLGGRRLREKTVQGGVTYQDNSIAYDALGRMRWVNDGSGGVTLTVDYDKVGNRTHIRTQLNNADVNTLPSDTHRYFQYDAMNRQILVDSSSVDGSVLGAEGHRLEYDYNGRRVMDTREGVRIELDANGQWAPQAGETVETYGYDGLSRLKTVTRDNVLVESRTYDGAGRVLTNSPGALDSGYIALHSVSQGVTGNDPIQARISQYDANGRITYQSTLAYVSPLVTPSGQTFTGVTYEYDAAGNVLGYLTANADPLNPTFTRTENGVQRGEGYKQAISLSQTVAAAGGSAGTPISQGGVGYNYDVNGFLTHTGDPGNQTVTQNHFFVNDANGTALYAYYGNPATPMQGQRQLVVNGEVLGRYGWVPDQRYAGVSFPVPGFTPYKQEASFSFGYQPINGNYPAGTPGTYAVGASDTLQGIAKNAYGDSSLWYLIADANGLGGNAELRVGQVLTIPAHVSNSDNSGTFRPYDPSKILGDTNPTMMALPQSQDKGCGGLGQVIVAIVAIVVTIYTAGAAAGAWGAAGTAGTATASAGVGATMTTGLTAMGGGYGVVGAAAAAVGGAVGSIASQAVGIGLGVQDSFSWRGVALGALGAGVGAGVGAALNVPGSLLAGNGWQAVGRAAISNALTQGVAVATGLQDQFSWRGVAAAAASSAIGQGLNQAMNYDPTMGFEFSKSLVSGVGSSVIAQVVRGGKITAASVASDAFGNIIGDSLAAANRSIDPANPYGYQPSSRGITGWRNFEGALGNALGDSIAAANGQGSASSIPGPVGADERSRILGMFSDGPSMTSRSNYNTEPSGNGILGWQDSQSAQPGMLRTGEVGTDAGISDAEITAMRKQNLSRAQDLAAQSLARDGGSGDVQGWIDAAGRYHVEFGLTSVPAERNFLMEGSASARASAVAPYNEMIANSDSWIGKAGGVAGRIGTNVGYDLADAGIGLYTLATNGNARAQLGNTLGYAATHPFNAMYAGYNKAEAYLARTDASQIAEDGARLLWGGVATAGTGKVATTVGVASVEGAVNTARWLAPKAAEIAESQIGRMGGRLYAVESGPSLSGSAAGSDFVGPQMPTTYVSAEMQEKILWGQRQLRSDGTPSNGLIGAHSGEIGNNLPNYAVEVLRSNPDGTSSVKLVKQFADGNVSKIKSSTLAPATWSDADFLDAIQRVGAPENAIAARLSDGSTFYRGTVRGVNMEVIKIGNRVTSAYPTGGPFSLLDSLGLAPKP
ncbi:Ig-like domain repeat protein [Variovorax sp. YR566]|uniref:Ig-like domain repeat protein n=1 Tax=Variovorax sp. YR566 TaxID=3450237 RepID=UPI003F81193F